MTLVDPEARERYVEPPLKVGVIDRSQGDAFAKWLHVRQTFVEAQGWKQGDDTDRYDTGDDTLHIVGMQDGDIAAGLRLTSCARPDQTLSWSMLSPAMQAEAQDRLPEDDPERIWDLTRLVAADDIDKAAAAEAFFEMLGAGMALNQELEPAPRWYFTTTLPLYAFFRRSGIEFTPIVRGQISPEDSYESVFCYADPVERTAWLSTAMHERHRRTYDAVARGVDAVTEGRMN